MLAENVYLYVYAHTRNEYFLSVIDASSHLCCQVGSVFFPSKLSVGCE